MTKEEAYKMAEKFLIRAYGSDNPEYVAKTITALGDEGNCKTASMLNDLRVELKKLMEE